jgi:hypothetical protein
MVRTPSTPGGRTALGVVLADTLLLVYGLFRPGSLPFSVAFLMAPSLVLLWAVVRNGSQDERRIAGWVTGGAAAGLVAVVVVNWLRG